MRFLVGTSGYSYKEWKGSFYPEKLPEKKMLSYYAQHFSTVEINSTFHRFPTTNVVEAWAQQVQAQSCTEDEYRGSFSDGFSAS